MALLRPSSASRWSNCPGSTRLETLYPEDDESPAAREGTAAHWWASEALHGREHGIGALAPNGEPVNIDMIEAARIYVQECAQLSFGPHVTARIEQPLQMHGLISSECEGTPDYYHVNSEAHKLTIIDFKYGHGYVEPMYNKQLTCYAAGIFEAYEFELDDVKGWEVEFIIVQPRNYRADGPVRRWSTLGWRIWKNFEQLATAAEEALRPNAQVRTGSQCTHCTARVHCPASQALGDKLLDVTEDAVPRHLPPVAVAIELTVVTAALKRLEARRDALEQEALAALRGGASLPGWQMGASTARERWTVDPATVAFYGEAWGLQLMKPPEAITPNQARKAGLSAEVVAQISERPRGEQKLLPVTDFHIAKIFGEGPIK